MALKVDGGRSNSVDRRPRPRITDLNELGRREMQQFDWRVDCLIQRTKANRLTKKNEAEISRLVLAMTSSQKQALQAAAQSALARKAVA
jgi:hypothetical protein